MSFGAFDLLPFASFFLVQLVVYTSPFSSAICMHPVPPLTTHTHGHFAVIVAALVASAQCRRPVV